MATVKSEKNTKKTTLVIVESPSKAVTIKGYLGSNYKVVASVGHIRDLPKSTIGVDIDNHFTPHYINIRGKGDIIKGLKKDAKAAKQVFLATDPDREGEAISWHIASELGLDITSKCRITFNEITKDAVRSAIREPRAIDENLVDSQQARRILDRIVGYKLSPLLWKKVKSGLSAGRVQSVATRIITERENEIRAFVPQEYWTVTANLLTAGGEPITAEFYGNADGKIRLCDKEAADRIVSAAQNGTFTVKGVHRSQKVRQPAPPFTTSTLQQEAYRKLNFRSQRTMKVAQELYEGIHLGQEHGGVQGLITYMRTDSLRVSSVAQSAAADLIRETYGADYLPKTPRVYKAKAGAQDAHEAIRPAHVDFKPSELRKYLSADQYKLYKLIWERFIASQMAAAVYDTVAVDLDNSGYLFKASGNQLKFRGYVAVYEVSTDEEENEVMTKLPEMTEKEKLSQKSVAGEQHFTEPPLRYTEASLIKFLEENGIGRPSTFATIITTILTRGYVKREGKSLMPTPLGEVTNTLMEEYFPEIVDYEFTAQMENKLDEIESGDIGLESVLSGFYDGFAPALSSAQEKILRENIQIPPETSEFVCDKCGKPMVYKNGRFGRFLACSDYPTCHNTMTIDKDGKPVEKKKTEAVLADFKCELCGADVLIRNGKFGEFYACSRYPECKFTKQKANVLDVKCPDCGAAILAKHAPKRRMQFYSCERYPDCSFSTWDLPTDKKCPVCGNMLLYRKGKKTYFCRDKACGYKEEEPDGGNEQ